MTGFEVGTTICAPALPADNVVTVIGLLTENTSNTIIS